VAEEQYRIRVGRESDIPAIIELMKASLGGGAIPRTREFWHWKHEENPFGPSSFWVAEAAQGLVGVRVFMRWTFRCGTDAVRAVRAVDTATHPDFQGRGIFRTLTLGLAEDVGKQGVSFIFNTPNDKSRPGYLKMGWVRAGRLSFWIRPERPLRMVQATLRDRVGRESSDQRAEEPLPGAELLEGQDTLALLERLGIPMGRRYATPVDRTYLAWRYARCPAARYGFATSDHRRNLIVYRVRRRRGMRELTLCDIFAERSPAGFRSTVEALRTLVSRVSPDYAINAAHRDAFEARIMITSGLVPAPFVGPIVVVRLLTSSTSLPDPRRLSSFAPSIGDMELF